MKGSDPNHSSVECKRKFLYFKTNKQEINKHLR